MRNCLIVIAVIAALLSGCTGNVPAGKQATGSSSSATPSPSAEVPSVPPPPARLDDTAVFDYLTLPDDLAQGRYSGWKRTNTLGSMAYAPLPLSGCATHRGEQITLQDGVFLAQVAQFGNGSLVTVDQQIVVLARGSAQAFADRKLGYDGDCPAGTTEALTAFEAPAGFTATKAFCHRPSPERPAFRRCSTALARGPVYVQIEVETVDGQAEAGRFLTKLAAAVAARMQQLPA
ncbi:MAG TPA: hypothetical protein VFC19_05665 [Candidatus Limnocylindrales bacterium]|nr:hypothetical protein [Candidatus Limnocylindrales bacterium]